MATQKKGRTLWEVFTQKPAGPVELQHYNPLKARIGSTVDIDLADYANMTFMVRELREYNRTVNGVPFQTCDYTLVARPADAEDDVTVRLRLNPTNQNGLSHNTLLLTLYDEFTFDQDDAKGLLEICKTSDQLQITDHDNNDAVYDFYRIGGVKEPQNANVVVVREIQNRTVPGKPEVGEVQFSMEYYDFSRIIKDNAKQDYEHFMFVEMDKDSGRQQMWWGKEIDPHRVSVV